MEKINKKGLLKFLLKASLTLIAAYVVIDKIDLQETKKILLNANIYWLIIALIIFNISKLFSSLRLNRLFKSIGLYLSNAYNLKLYYVGMFYNLFLPGGIGGDGYKVFLLNRNFKKPVRLLIGATLLDRLSGMTALVFLAFLLGLFLDLTFTVQWITLFLIIIIILIYPVYYLIVRLLFKNFSDAFHITNFQSLGVQISQLICAMFILWALDVNSLYIEYQVLFLISSVVAVLPFTIGGVGARELVFVFGANYLFIDRNTAVAFSLLFFILTALSSFAGVFLETKLRKPE